jgi:transposase
MDGTPAEQWRISDDFWLLVEPLIPKRVNTHRFGGGKPPKPDRQCLDAIFYVLRTGCQWKALDATGICPGSTAHDRFQLWAEQGVFLAMWEHGLMLYDELAGIDWAWLSMDGCQTKAPLGGEKDGQQPHRPGQEGGQAQPADRRGRRPARPGRGRGQPQRHEAGRGHPRQHPGGSPRADQGEAAGDVHGQGV